MKFQTLAKLLACLQIKANQVDLRRPLDLQSVIWLLEGVVADAFSPMRCKS